MAHADKGMGGAEASTAHVAGARKDTKQAGGKGVSSKLRPGKKTHQRGVGRGDPPPFYSASSPGTSGCGGGAEESTLRVTAWSTSSAAS